jgi:hypothetical protein
MREGYELHVCDGCGEEKECRHIIDPYEEEVNGGIDLVWECDECYAESCDYI